VEMKGLCREDFSSEGREKDEMMIEKGIGGLDERSESGKNWECLEI
jgi:hypothetical protein